jgi:signal transduction histidine kinase
MNLVTNARDAMPGGGAIAVRVGEARVTGEQGPPGAYVVLEVSDTGVGMDEATRQRLFEPFFTTKAQGSGLGLPIVYQIVDRSGGFLHVDSAPGRGTSIRAYLPRIASAPAAECPGPPAPESVPH